MSFDIQDWLPYRLWRLSQEVGELLEEFSSEKFGVKNEGWRFMAILSKVAPISAKDIGGILNIDQVQVTRTLNKILEKGYVNRRTDPNDRRKIILNLSKKGEAVYGSIAEKAIRLEAEMLKNLTNIAKDEFSETTFKLQQNIGKLRD